MSNLVLIEMWPAVAAARAAFLLALEDVTEEQARRPPPDEPGGWCVLQVAQHVLGWTENVEVVIERTAEGRSAMKHPRGYLPAEAPQTLTAVRLALATASIGFLALAQRVSEQADAAATVTHEVFGPLNYRDWFARCPLHDIDHRRQVEALKAAF